MKKMCMYFDFTGLPRAWAIADKEEDARESARKHLREYCAEKKALGDRVEMTDPSFFACKIADVMVGEG